jgi:hypothetical protein
MRKTMMVAAALTLGALTLGVMGAGVASADDVRGGTTAGPQVTHIPPQQADTVETQRWDNPFE